MTFYPGQAQVSYEDELKHADIAANNSQIAGSQHNFNTSSPAIDPYSYSNYVHHQRRMMGLPVVSMPPYLLGQQFLPIRYG